MIGSLCKTSKVVALVLAFSVCADAAPVHLRTNALEHPLGVDTARPAFSWQSDATTPDWLQSAYEILVGTDAEHLRPGKAAVWDSGRVTSSESVDIVYAGAPLQSQRRYAWKVMVWDVHGKETVSPAAWFETGLMNVGDWKADWILRRDPADEQELKAIRWIWLPGQDARQVPSATPAEFRYRLHLDAQPQAASLHVLVRGHFTASVNGTITGHHDEFGAFDREELVGLLHAGDNEIELKVTSQRARAPTESAPSAVAASIHVTLANGEEERIVTDERWQARAGSDDNAAATNSKRSSSRAAIRCTAPMKPPGPPPTMARRRRRPFLSSDFISRLTGFSFLAISYQ